jgi:hypothetical protein
VPTFTSNASATGSFGVPFSFTVRSDGNPAPTLSKTSGALPKDITFTDNGDGTATIAGPPAAASDLGVYTLNFKAKSSQGTATQAFTLTLNKAPVLNAIASKTAKVGTAFSLNVVSKGYTPAALSAASNRRSRHHVGGLSGSDDRSAVQLPGDHDRVPGAARKPVRRAA